MITRRHFIKKVGTAGAALPLLSQSAFSAHHKPNEMIKHPVCIFSKHLQWLDFEDVGKFTRDLGLDGVELSVRPGGHVEPDQVETALPRAVEKITASGVSVPMMVTRISDPDDPATEKVIKTAAGLGIKNYRMAYYSYDNSRGILEHLDELKGKFARLAELNRKYRIHGAYQNHDGTRVGSSLWDIWYLVRDLDPNWMGCQFDIRHAMAEGGRSWVNDLKLLRGHIRSTVAKDFIWARNNSGAWKSKHVPIGEGMVDFDAFYRLIRELQIPGPITMHVEYPMFDRDPGELSLSEKFRQAEKAISADLKHLHMHLKNTGLRS